MSSRSTPEAAPTRKAAKVIATDPRGRIDEPGRVVVSGTATDGRVVDAVSFRVRGKGGSEVVVPAAGTAEFEVAAPMVDDVPTETFSWDVRLHLRAADGTETVRRLNAGTGEQFTRTSRTGELHGRPAWWYATRDGELSLRVGAHRDPRMTVTDTRVTGLAHGFDFTSTLTTVGADISTLELLVTVRATDFAVRLPVEVTGTEGDPVSQDETHRIRGMVDLAALVRAGLPADEQAIDIALVAQAEGGTTLRRGLSLADDLAAMDRLKPIIATEDGRTQVLVPGVTFKSKNLTFAREVFTEDAYRYLTRLRRLGPLWSLIRVFSRVWVIGETPYKAQDAGFHLFRWIREHRPKVRARYVISADSPERAVVEPLGHVVTLRSREHIRACFLARRFATSHKVEFVLATTDRRATRWMRGNRVFLQHGVLGTKNMVDTYGRLSPSFHTDFFHVSSPREREMVVNDLRYRKHQVRVTGLARFDRLLAPGDAPQGLLVIPTWRDWLLRADDFEDSEFLQRWRAFLSSAPLREAIADGLPVTVILHPNMRFYGSALAAEGVTVLQQGDVDVQTLLRSHAAMVTDYSSVGFDFSFQGRPVFYHQFDRDQFLGKRPSHLDLDSDLPGDVFLDAETLAAAVVASWRAGFPQSREHARRASLFLAPTRSSYGEQVFESVRTAKSWWVPLWRLRDSERGRRTYGRFRAGGLYEPTMKLISWIGRRLPRRQLAVFESNVGRAAADSPRAIYDEVVARDLDLDLVWSTRDTFRPRDLRTRKVEPGSPAFHWALARARYWVNNQNFGPPLTRPRGTTYVQTWHGTPLKRMQFDAVSTAGRTEGYLDRVAAKTATWSTLVSPSPYATEAFRSAFRYEGPVLEVGYPRNDVLVTDAADRADLTRRRLGLPTGARVVLYAPTFRDDVKKGDQFSWDGVLDWVALVDGLAPDTVILVRRHSVVRGSLRIPPELAGRVRDVSAYGDTQDLLCLADVLVTDYSSVMFDYALLDRPIVLFCYDLEHYRDELRGFYFDLEAQAPGALARTQDQLRDALLTAESGDPEHAEARRRFRERFAPLDDGHATARAVDEVFGR